MPNTHAPAANGTLVRGYQKEPPGPSELDIALPAMDALGEEFTRLAAVNAELVGRLRGTAAEPSRSADAAEDGDLSAVRHENAALRAHVAELEQAILDQRDESAWAEAQAEYEALLDEKSEVIRSLHLKLQELQEGTRRAADEPIPREEELIQMKKELEEQRRQLAEDEEAVMAQMRQMELALSKDRAELARQRQDVQRLQADLNREIEQADREPGLRERLQSLRRGHEAPNKEVAATTAVSQDSQKSSGLFRRLFG
jgi:chromosome segregation ATPase